MTSPSPINNVSPSPALTLLNTPLPCIHAREQDIQRKVNVALARAKRAEGLVSALRHENSSLRAKLKMLEQENGLNPSLAATIETPKTKTRRVNMLK